MPFNSYLFILVFLPVTWLAYRAAAWLGATGTGTSERERRARLAVLIVAALVFYALACAWALPILALSIAGNGLCLAAIGRSAGVWRRRWLVLGVTANVAALAGFKFIPFIGGKVLHLAWMPPVLRDLALPLGLSFFTFQQISLLVDHARGVVPRVAPATYVASILFFPYLVSGPITYFREFAPQIDAPDADWRGDLGAGASLFTIGLFKKVILADTMALWVDPLFDALGAGAHPPFIQAWAMVVGYLLLLYFDFSGYSDMAAGCARLFGVRLPLNFYSPFRVTSIVDWWRRWHMTLGRFVGDYVFAPLAVPLTRLAAMRGLGRWGVTAAGVLLPTAIAMFVIGVWHGGNWTFVAFGLLHAAYMVVAEGWRFFAKKRGKRPALVPSLPGWLGNVLTLLAVLIAIAPFRSPDMHTTVHLWAGMADLGGAALPWPALAPIGGWLVAGELAVAVAIVALLPNTAQLLAVLDPSLPFAGAATDSGGAIRLRWQANAAWGALMGAMLAVALVFISRGTNSFVYFNF